jgi:hypothetical protein
MPVSKPDMIDFKITIDDRIVSGLEAVAVERHQSRADLIRDIFYSALYTHHKRTPYALMQAPRYPLKSACCPPNVRIARDVGGAFKQVRVDAHGLITNAELDEPAAARQRGAPGRPARALDPRAAGFPRDADLRVGTAAPTPSPVRRDDPVIGADDPEDDPFAE